MDLRRQEEERGCYNPSSSSHSPAALPPPPHPMIKDSAFPKPLLPPNSSLVQRGSAERSGTDTRNNEAGGGGYALTPSPFNPAPHRHHAMPGRSGGLKSPASATSSCGNSVQLIEVAWNYRECQRNHAAGIGGHVVDGCCEYMPSNDATLRCAACGCHRSFHRKVCNPNPNSGTPPLFSPNNGAAMRSNKTPPQLLPPPPVPPPSQPPRSTTDQSSSEEMLGGTPSQAATASPNKKRYRTKFTPEQKAKMFRFAESLSWRFQKPDDEAIDKFCAESGVNRQVLKVWMHNNKYTYKKQEQAPQYQPSPSPQPQQYLLPQDQGQHQDHHHQQMH